VSPLFPLGNVQVIDGLQVPVPLAAHSVGSHTPMGQLPFGQL